MNTNSYPLLEGHNPEVTERAYIETLNALVSVLATLRGDADNLRFANYERAKFLDRVADCIGDLVADIREEQESRCPNTYLLP